MGTTKSNGKFFYGWWIVLGCTVIMAVLFASIINTFSLYVLPVTQELGIGRSSFTYFYSIVTIVSMLANPVFGMLINKIDIRAMVSGCVILAFLGDLLLSRSTGLGMIYAGGVIMGIALSGGATIPVSVLITNWFKKQRALCIGIAMAGSGIGALIFSPLATWLIGSYGWRTAYLVMGIIILACILPFSLFIFRLKPEDKGLIAYGADEVADEEKKPAEATGFSYKETLKKPMFWLLCATIILVAIVINAVVVNFAPMLTDLGAPKNVITVSLSLAGIFIIIGKILAGRVFDRFGSMIGTLMLMFCCIVQFFFLYNPTTMIMALLFIVFHGLSAPSANLLPAIIIGPLFGDRDYSSKYGITSLCASLGAALSSFVAGFFYNASHSYIGLINFSLGASVVCLVLFVLIIRSAQKKPKPKILLHNLLKAVEKRFSPEDHFRLRSAFYF